MTDVKLNNSYYKSVDKIQGPGILVLHAWWGLNDFIKQLCEKLTKEGYLVIGFGDIFKGDFSENTFTAVLDDVNPIIDLSVHQEITVTLNESLDRILYLKLVYSSVPGATSSAYKIESTIEIENIDGGQLVSRHVGRCIV